MNYATQTSVRVYHWKLLRVLLSFWFLVVLLPLYFILIIAIFDILQHYNFATIIAWLSGLGITLVFTFMTLPAWHFRLELAPEGVTFIYPGFYRIYTPWENIEKLGKITRLRISTSFILRKPASQDISFAEGKLQRQAVIERRSFLATRQDLPKTFFTTIPFFAYVPKKEWRDGDLQIYLQRYAPHLLENRGEYGRIVSL